MNKKSDVFAINCGYSLEDNEISKERYLIGVRGSGFRHKVATLSGQL